MIELLLNAENALALGLLDQAERTFRQVLDADPRNGIAAVGLSRVALERGDDATALALAQAALAIDPENATARRMIDRLEEVARYRAVASAGDSAADAAVATRAVASAGDSAADAAVATGAGGDAVATSAAGDAAAAAGDAAAAAVATGSAADAAVATGVAGDPGDPGAVAVVATSRAVPAATTTAAPSVTMSTSAPSVPAPERPGLLRRLLRRS